MVHAVLHRDFKFILRHVVHNRPLRHILRKRRDFLQYFPRPLHQRAHTFPGQRANGEIFVAGRFDFLLERFDLGRIRQINLIGRDNLLLFRQLRAVNGQLLIDDAEIFQRIAPFASRRVQHMNQDARALHMAQKFVAEPDAAARPLDESRNVRHDETALIRKLHDAQMRLERREMIRRHFRPRARHFPDETRFPDARKPQKPHIGQDFQLQAHFFFLARLPFFRIRRRPYCGRRKMLIAPSAMAAAHEERLLPFVREIRQ